MQSKGSMAPTRCWRGSKQNAALEIIIASNHCTIITASSHLIHNSPLLLSLFSLPPHVSLCLSSNM